MPRVSELAELPPKARAQRGIDWEQIADGRIWELIAGEDFKGKPEGVESRIQTRAKKMGRTVETRVQIGEHGEPTIILVQFDRPPSEESGGEGQHNDGAWQ